ncbi:hypothetical protein FRC08_004465 [Ceratobasidium sp. 394]|nr:hypothetical protein FRC08_004465 [Ceratobasidium sp. 394]
MPRAADDDDLPPGQTVFFEDEDEDKEDEDEEQVNRPGNPANPLHLEIKDRLDTNLPDVAVGSLTHWNKEYWRLSKESIDKQNTFALTGHFLYPKTGKVHRFEFDPEMHRRQPEDIVFTQVCDIDSVLIIVDGDFPIHPNAVVQYYMLPDLNYTLTSSLHIPPIRVTVDEEHIDAAIHTIPNCRFAQVKRTLIRILFPQLIGQLQHQSNHCFVGDHYLWPFYDFAVRPAAKAILPDHYDRTWPVDFDAEHYRAQPILGNHLQQTSRDFRGRDLNPLLRRIRELVDACPELDWACGFLFLVEIRGVKNWSVHDPEPPLELDPDQSNLVLDSNSPRLEALERLLKHFPLDEVEQDKCYVDIATTFSVANGNGHPLCALPLANIHTEMINHFTQHPMDKCE